MVTYEITAIVDALFAAAYEEYMIGRHIPDLLATGYFASATFSKSIPPSTECGRVYGI